MSDWIETAPAANTGDGEEERLYDELCAWTLGLLDAAFAHQHAVDAWAVQRADERTKPIAVGFGLVGLYLHLERGLTGREVQRMHMLLARRRQEWPRFVLPRERGAMTASDVMAARPGPERLRALDAWCAAVWAACAASRPAVVELLARHGIG